MKIKFLLPILLAALVGAGCSSLIPKRVELFQDKVESFPETQKKDREAERKALEAAQEKVRDLKQKAIEQGLHEELINDIKDLEDLSDALAKNAGPPLKAPKGTAQELARALKESTAAYVEKVFKFRSDNNENTGKKIEGTGFLQIPYFIWLIMVMGVVVIGLILLSVGWTALKAYSATNPPLALGLNAVQMGGKAAKDMLSQVIKGTQSFKKTLEARVKEGAAISAEEVKELLRNAHNEAQDAETRKVVEHLTKE